MTVTVNHCCSGNKEHSCTFPCCTAGVAWLVLHFPAGLLAVRGLDWLGKWGSLSLPCPASYKQEVCDHIGLLSPGSTAPRAVLWASSTASPSSTGGAQASPGSLSECSSPPSTGPIPTMSSSNGTLQTQSLLVCGWVAQPALKRILWLSHLLDWCSARSPSWQGRLPLASGNLLYLVYRCHRCHLFPSCIDHISCGYISLCLSPDPAREFFLKH